MKKGKNNGGAACLIAKPIIPVSYGVFITALGEHFYDNAIPDDINKLGKREALKILGNRLRMYGQQGQFHDGFWESAGSEAFDPYDNAIKVASYWVAKNYPFLITDNPQP